MPKKKRPNAAKSQPEVWVSSDLMLKLKGQGGTRGTHVPQSPYLVLADRFLGLTPSDAVVAGKAGHRPAATHVHKPREAAAPAEPPPRTLAAAAGFGANDGVLSASMPRTLYPKPPTRPAPPKPPKVLLSRPPERPNGPKLRPPKPPKVSFGYRRRKADPPNSC